MRQMLFISDGEDDLAVSVILQKYTYAYLLVF